MNKMTGYSIGYRKDAMVAVGVSPAGENRWRIEHLEQGLPGAQPSASMIQDLARNKGALTLVTPGSEVKTSLTSLPRLKKKEMNRAALGWVSRDEGLPVDKLRVSWSERRREQGEEEKTKTDVFLLYTEKETVDRYLSPVEIWGGRPTRMVPDYMILETMYRYHGRENADLKGWNVVYVGRDDQFLLVSTPSGLLMTRPLPADLSQGENADEHLERLATEVDRSVFFARQTEYNPNIERIIVCGERELAEGLVERLKNETSLETEFWDVAALFDWGGRELESQLFIPAMAAALAPVSSRSNLLSSRSRSVLNPAMRQKLILAGTTAAVAVVPVLVIGGLLTQGIQNHYLDRARGRLDEARYQAQLATDIYKAEKVLQQREEHIQTADRFEKDYAGVLLHLASLTPEEIIFQDLRIKETQDGRLVLFLSGESQSDRVEVAQQSFLVFQKALNESQLLASVGEPRKLLITEENDQGVVVKKVEFSMEYRVQDGPSGVQDLESADLAGVFFNGGGQR